MTGKYERIVTHNDFDGIVSASICSHVFQIENIMFAGPNTITRSELPISVNDIVCDLPYPLECGLWFDHHEGNLEDLKYRKITPDDIEGSFALKPSCSRVVYEYYTGKGTGFPDFFETMVAEADIIDSFNYATVEEWRKQTPGKIIDASIKVKDDIPGIKRSYMKQLVIALKGQSIGDVAELDSVRERYRRYCDQENKMLGLIENDAAFHPEDKDKEIIVLDMTHHNRRPYITKNLAFLLYPGSMAVLEINSLFKRGTKSNDLGLSMSLSISLNNREHRHDVGEIMRELNIGDGHAGAAAGTARCSSKNEMLKKKKSLLDEIVETWQAQT